MLICWCVELHQQVETVQHLQRLLLDSSISLKSHYGALSTLTALGQNTLESYFWPILDPYVSILEEQKEVASTDVQYIKGAIVVRHLAFIQLYLCYNNYISLIIWVLLWDSFTLFCNSNKKSNFYKNLDRIFFNLLSVSQ